MATVKALTVRYLVLLATGYSPWLHELEAIAVEYELDGPLDMKQKWRFIRDDNFFVQHQCSEAQGKRAAQKIRKFFDKASPFSALKDTPAHLQVRLLPGFDSYRKNFKFSKDRRAHYDERLSLITSYCSVSTVALEEQLVLHRLSGTRLRLWQKVFLAEIIPAMENNPFSDAAKAKPVPLRTLLLSNHRPEKAERATMRKLALFLRQEKKLDDFTQALLAWQGFDDTGMDILEAMFPEGLRALEAKITP